MSKKKTHEEFVEQVEGLVGDEYTLLSAYDGANFKVSIKHNSKECNNYTFEVMPRNFVSNGTRCPICTQKRARGSRRWDHSSFLLKIKELVSDEYEVLENYINSRTNIKFKHNKCGTIFSSKPNNFINGSRCPICGIEVAREKRRKSLKEVQELIFNEVNGEYELVDKKYHNISTPLKIRHNKCGKICKISLNNFLRDTRCKYCNESIGEAKIRCYLENNNIPHETQYTFNDLVGKNKAKYRFDFAIFLNNKLFCLIEYDGIYHYEPIRGQENLLSQQFRDQEKTNYCLQNNIKLIRVPYWEMENIESLLKKELSIITSIPCQA